MKANPPLGIFDSGIGGLSHAKAIANHLPHQSLIYIGDIQHFPYGNKTEAELQSYCLPIVDYLLSQGCKTIVVACNTATAAALPLIQERAKGKAEVLDVVSVIVEHGTKHFSGKKLGLIGTDYTVASRIYEQDFQQCDSAIKLYSLATPRLIYQIESDIEHFNQSYQDIISHYLSDEKLQGIEALILACTHYPFVKDQISQYYGGKLPLIDSATLVADRLSKKSDGPGDLTMKPEHHFLMTQASVPFNTAVNYFFKQDAELLLLP